MPDGSACGKTMEDLRPENLAYLEARLRECRGRPDLHKRTLAEYQRLIECNRNSASGADYIDQVGDMFELSRAEQLDRRANLGALYERLEYPEALEAQRERYQAIRAAKGHVDLHEQIQAVNQRTQKRAGLHFEILNQLATFMAVLAGCLAEPEAERRGRAGVAMEEWLKLKELDPGLDWNKIKGHRMLRASLIWDDERLGELERFFEQVYREFTR